MLHRLNMVQRIGRPLCNIALKISYRSKVPWFYLARNFGDNTKKVTSESTGIDTENLESSNIEDTHIITPDDIVLKGIDEVTETTYLIPDNMIFCAESEEESTKDDNSKAESTVGAYYDPMTDKMVSATFGARDKATQYNATAKGSCGEPKSTLGEFYAKGSESVKSAMCDVRSESCEYESSSTTPHNHENTDENIEAAKEKVKSSVSEAIHRSLEFSEHAMERADEARSSLIHSYDSASQELRTSSSDPDSVDIEELKYQKERINEAKSNISEAYHPSSTEEVVKSAASHVKEVVSEYAESAKETVEQTIQETWDKVIGKK